MTISITENNPVYIDAFGRLSSISNERNDKNPQNNAPFKTEIVPFVIGLFLVRSTCLSKSLSMMSFTMHPAPRTIMAPMQNNPRKYQGILTSDPSNSPKLAGQNTKKKPTG